MTFEELMRNVRRDEAARQRILVRASRLVNLAAFDAAEMAEMSAKDLAKKVLQKLGIKPESDDPVKELETYLEGRDAGQRTKGVDRGGAERVWRGSGIDGAEGGSLVDRYINGQL
ncbi:MAG: hypothetical protein ACYDAE_00300 [Steroidobacteraceae bacterium]